MEPKWAPEIHVPSLYTEVGVSILTTATLVPMSGESMHGEGVSLDEFQALEQKVLRAVEIVRREREARSTAEAESAALREQVRTLTEQIEALTSASNSAQGQITTLNQEREAVRLRVEKMMQQIDELL